MPGDLITKERQYQLGSLLMGPDTPYVVQKADGLGMPQIRSSRAENSGDDGDLLTGQDYADSRTITVDVGIHDDYPFHDSFADSIDALMAELAPMRSGLKDFAFRLVDRGVLYCPVRPIRHSDTINPLYHKGMTFVTFQLYAPRPHILSVAESEETVTLAGGVNSGQATFAGGGTYRAKPIISIAGPCRNPRLTHVGQGRALRIDMNVQASEELVIDSRDRTVRLDGVNVYENVRHDNQWWDLLAASNTVQYSRSSTALNGATSVATISWRASRLGV